MSNRFIILTYAKYDFNSEVYNKWKKTGKIIFDLLELPLDILLLKKIKNYNICSIENYLLEDIRDTDVLIVIEPLACTIDMKHECSGECNTTNFSKYQRFNDDKIYAEYFIILKNKIIEIIKLYKTKILYLYENPHNFYKHDWIITSQFINYFDFVFGRNALIIDNKSYFWTPNTNCLKNLMQYSYNIPSNIDNIFEPIFDNKLIIYKEFSQKKLIINSPIMSDWGNIRQKLIKYLSDKYKIDVYGHKFEKYPNYIVDIQSNETKYNTGGRYNTQIPGKDHWVSLQTNVFSNYKFVIVCENDYSYGCISERLFIVLYSGAIPIYYGNDISFLFNNKLPIGIIDGNTFNTPDDMMTYINNISEIEYNKMVNSNNLILKEYIISTSGESIFNFIIETVLGVRITNNIINNANNILAKQNNIVRKKLSLDLPNHIGIMKKYIFTYKNNEDGGIQIINGYNYFPPKIFMYSFDKNIITNKNIKVTSVFYTDKWAIGAHTTYKLDTFNKLKTFNNNDTIRLYKNTYGYIEFIIIKKNQKNDIITLNLKIDYYKLFPSDKNNIITNIFDTNFRQNWTIV